MVEPRIEDLPDEETVVREVREFIKQSEGADSRERQRMLHDLRFVYEDHTQWDQTTLTARGDNRPHYVFNKVLLPVNNVIGDQRQASPQIKVRPTDGDSDPDVAEILAGMVRNIEELSGAQTAYDMGFKFAVAGGWGAWRVLPEFRSDASFEQEIFIKPIYNPFTVYWDPLAQEPTKKDQNKCVVAERISREVHRAMFGDEKADNATNVPASRDGRGWFTTDQVRIAEYFKRVPAEKEIALLTDGRVVVLTDEIRTSLEEAKAENEKNSELDLPVIQTDEDGNKKTRVAKTFKVTWWKVDGVQILEGPIVYDWRFIPVVKCCGRFINIEGEHLTQSLIRHAKDAQRVYNYDRTTMSEVVGNTPRSPYLATDAMIMNHEKQWKNINAKNMPVLLYDVDDNAPGAGGMPQRVPVAEIPGALIALAQLDADDVKSATGLFDPSLGERGPQESGEAIRARQQEGDTGSFEFMDNFAKALEFTGEILVDMIPKVYDTERVVRIIGLDGQEDFEKINAYNENRRKKIDLGAGRYSVGVTVGPSFSTQRRETARNLLDAAGTMPIIAEVGADLIVRNMDMSESDELEKRIRSRLISQGIIPPTEEEQEELPPEQPDQVALALVGTEEAKQQALQAKAAKDAQAAQEAEQMVPMKTLQEMEDLIGKKLDNRFKEEEIRLARKEAGEVRINVDD